MPKEQVTAAQPHNVERLREEINAKNFIKSKIVQIQKLGLQPENQITALQTMINDSELSEQEQKTFQTDEAHKIINKAREFIKKLEPGDFSIRNRSYAKYKAYNFSIAYIKRKLQSIEKSSKAKTHVSADSKYAQTMFANKSKLQDSSQQKYYIHMYSTKAPEDFVKELTAFVNKKRTTSARTNEQEMQTYKPLNHKQIQQWLSNHMVLRHDIISINLDSIKEDVSFMTIINKDYRNYFLKVSLSENDLLIHAIYKWSRLVVKCESPFPRMPEEYLDANNKQAIKKMRDTIKESQSPDLSQESSEQSAPDPSQDLPTQLDKRKSCCLM